MRIAKNNLCGESSRVMDLVSAMRPDHTAFLGMGTISPLRRAGEIVPVDSIMEKALARCSPMMGRDCLRMPLGMPQEPEAFQLGIRDMVVVSSLRVMGERMAFMVCAWAVMGV